MTVDEVSVVLDTMQDFYVVEGLLFGFILCSTLFILFDIVMSILFRNNSKDKKSKSKEYNKIDKGN